MRALRVRKLYDGTMSPPMENAVVVLNGERVEAVLENCAQNHLERWSLEVEDRSDCVMTPGLIDSHVHLMLPGDGTAGEDLLCLASPGEIQILAYQNALDALENGVTTLRDVGAALDVELATRAFFRQKGRIGPDILCCGKPLTATGGHCYYMGAEADGCDELRKMIRRQQKKGIDWVKLMATAGGTKGISQGDPFTLEELRAAVAEAHRQNLKITMHASRINGLRKAVESRPDGIEHCQFTDNWQVVRDKALAERICEYGIHPCHTMAVNVSLLTYLRSTPREEWTEAQAKDYAGQLRWLDLMPEQLQFQLEQGVPTVGGSDAGWRYTLFCDGMATSIEMMSLAGMSFLQILYACTGHNAEYLGIADRLGTVRPGLQADLVLLKQDPAENISAYRSVEAVFKKGQPVAPRRPSGNGTLPVWAYRNRL